MAVGMTLAVYAGLLVALFVVGRKEDARTWARFLPDCAVLFSRLLRDERVARRHKLVLILLIGYLSLPFDLVPDFIPVVGALDDAVIVALVLRIVLRSSKPELVRELWPGPERSLRLMLRLAGAAS